MALITGNDLDNLLSGTAGDDTILGLGGNDQLNGEAGNDSIEGGNGADVITAGAGTDTVLGGAGADSILGGSENDSLDGGAGNDTINGEAGDDTIAGGSENNSLYGGDGNDTLSGGDGNDRLEGNERNDTLMGEAGNDSIYGGPGNDSSVGGDGADYLEDLDGNNTVQGGAGNDTIYGAGLIEGGDDNDTLNYYGYSYYGQTAATVLGGAGNDLIREYGTNLSGAILDGGDGNDTINGSGYNETILGASGNDSLNGQAGADSIDGGTGDDTINGGAGNDIIDGGDGANIAIYSGSRSQYSVVGDAIGLTLYDNRGGTPDGVDVVRNVGVLRFSDQDVSVESGLSGVLLEGTPGDDPALIGTILNDTIRGLAGNDVLSGLAANDLLEGGDGNDTLQGGSGNDTIDGGTGLNRAIFAGNRADYSISPNGGTLSGTTTVVDLQPAINGNDGTDVLTGVRLLQFLDQLYAINTPPLAVADSATTSEDTAISISLASLIANDSDADSDHLSITGFSAVTNATASISGGNLVFTPAANYNGTGVVTYTLSDGFTTTPGTLSIAVSSVNEAPSGADKTITVLEDTAYSFTAADFGFSDPADAAGAAGANSLQSVIVTNLPGTGTLRLSGAAVSAGQEIAAASLTSLTYTPAANANGSAIAAFSFRVRDTGGTANGGIDLDPTPNTIRFDVTPVNDAPAGANGTITAAENSTYTFTAADFGFTDPIDAASSSGPNTLQSVILTSLPAAGTLQLGGAAVSVGQEIAAASLGTLVYTPAANATGSIGAAWSGSGSVQSTQGLSAYGGFGNLHLKNDDTGASVLMLTGLGAHSQITLNFSLAIWDSVDANPGGYPYGDRFVVQLDNTDLINEAFGNYGTPGGLPIGPGSAVALPQGNYGYSGWIDSARVVSISAAHTGSSAVFSFAFPNSEGGANESFGLDNLSISINATPLSVAPADTIVYTQNFESGIANGNTVSSFSFQVRDNGGNANGGIDLDPTPNTISINVTPINQPPAGSDQTITALEDSVYTFTAADFGFTDPIDASRPSGANSLQSVIISSLPAAGNLQLGGVAVTAAQEILAANLASLTYTPAANANGNAVASFTFQVRDNGGTAGGGSDLDSTPNTITVSLTPVNDAPAGADKTITIDEDFQSQVIFVDNFDLNPAGLNITPQGWFLGNTGTLDIIGTGYIDLLPGNGFYIDLDGSTASPGLLTKSLALEGGVTYELGFDLAGGQRGSSETVDVIFASASMQISRDSSDPFARSTLEFTPFVSGTYQLSFLNRGGDNHGALLDNVVV